MMATLLISQIMQTQQVKPSRRDYPVDWERKKRKSQWSVAFAQKERDKPDRRAHLPRRHIFPCGSPDSWRYAQTNSEADKPLTLVILVIHEEKDRRKVAVVSEVGRLTRVR
jgi:hypothetical protein